MNFFLSFFKKGVDLTKKFVILYLLKDEISLSKIKKNTD